MGRGERAGGADGGGGGERADGGGGDALLVGLLRSLVLPLEHSIELAQRTGAPPSRTREPLQHRAPPFLHLHLLFRAGGGGERADGGGGDALLVGLLRSLVLPLEHSIELAQRTGAPPSRTREPLQHRALPFLHLHLLSLPDPPLHVRHLVAVLVHLPSQDHQVLRQNFLFHSRPLAAAAFTRSAWGASAGPVILVSIAEFPVRCSTEKSGSTFIPTG